MSSLIFLMQMSGAAPTFEEAKRKLDELKEPLRIVDEIRQLDARREALVKRLGELVPVAEGKSSSDPPPVAPAAIVPWVDAPGTTIDISWKFEPENKRLDGHHRMIKHAHVCELRTMIGEWTGIAPVLLNLFHPVDGTELPPFKTLQHALAPLQRVGDFDTATVVVRIYQPPQKEQTCGQCLIA
jgi:hypothetical protein